MGLEPVSDPLSISQFPAEMIMVRLGRKSWYIWISRLNLAGTWRVCSYLNSVIKQGDGEDQEQGNLKICFAFLFRFMRRPRRATEYKNLGVSPQHREEGTALVNAQCSVLGKTNIIAPGSRCCTSTSCSAGLSTAHLHLQLKIREGSPFTT